MWDYTVMVHFQHGIRPVLNIHFSWTLAICLWPPEKGESVQFHMVSYCSAIKYTLFGYTLAEINRQPINIILVAKNVFEC